ncbi:MAG: HAMP domain-containing histidine kinase [Actinobacteria bacterium]|nr:HAMP domain-containing histidine kinase [Actinomycetota bacterium]
MTFVAVPLPLLLVGLVARYTGVTAAGWALITVAVAAAALSAAVAARWCAEQRLRSDVARHERELVHTKRQILALVSHELRTPVTGVVGFSRTLSGRLDALDHDTLRLFVDAIDEHSNRLARLIDNVVVASRTPLVVVGGTCQLSTALSKAVARVGVDPDGARLQVALEGSLDACIDEEAAIRILANLIDNAIKFGDPEARIYLDGHVRNGHVVIRVANAGPAIPLGLRSALYDPFVQGDTTDTRTADGLGLGLHVCRQLVEAYGGSIHLVDHPRLTVFEIGLPAARVEPRRQVELPRPRRGPDARDVADGGRPSGRRPSTDRLVDHTPATVPTRRARVG